MLTFGMQSRGRQIEGATTGSGLCTDSRFSTVSGCCSLPSLSHTVAAGCMVVLEVIIVYMVNWRGIPAICWLHDVKGKVLAAVNVAMQIVASNK